MLCLALLLSACSTVQIPNVKIHAEIPFQDGAEAAFIETVSHEKGIIPNHQWEAQRPYMLMIHIDDWSEIKKSWYSACRIAGPKCNVAVDSIDGIVRQLDGLARQVMEGK